MLFYRLIEAMKYSELILKIHIFVGNIITRLEWLDAGHYLSRSEDLEISSIGKRIKTISPTCFPYSFTQKYNDIQITCRIDDEGYPFVIEDGKRIFGKKSWTKDKMVEYYKSLLLEQDKESPHCYLSEKKRYPDSGDVLVDLGAAEGFFALRLIEDISKAYLFECDEEWIIPLSKTFEPYKDKVEIINKYIGKDENLQNNVTTLDAFFCGKKYDFVKADIEGAEPDMLLGGKNTLAKCKRLVVCAYHNQDDEQRIINSLDDLGYNVDINKGYMLYYSYFRKFRRPYIRRGVIYGKK